MKKQKANIYKPRLPKFNMKKKLKKWGNSLVVVFNKEDQDIYSLIEGDTIDLGDMIKQEVKNGKRKTKTSGDTNIRKKE